MCGAVEVKGDFKFFKESCCVCSVFFAYLNNSTQCQEPACVVDTLRSESVTSITACLELNQVSFKQEVHKVFNEVGVAARACRSDAPETTCYRQCMTHVGEAIRTKVSTTEPDL